MASLLLDLLPIVLISAIVPGPIVLTILLLQGKHGAIGGLAFGTGAVVFRLLQGVILGFVQTTDTVATEEVAHPMQAILMLVIAILMITSGVRLWLGGEDLDAPPPKWLKSIERITPRRAFLIGMAVIALSAKQWFFTIAAVQAIGYAYPTPITSSLLFLLYAVVAALPLLVPVLLMTVAPAKTTPVLHNWRTWLETNIHAVKIAVSILFGLLFLWKGLALLLG